MGPLFLLLCLALSATAAAADLRVLRADERGLRLLVEVDPGVGPGGHGIAAPGLPRGAGPDGVDLPFIAELVAAPPGARLRLAIRSSSERVVDEVVLASSSTAVPLDLAGQADLARTEPAGLLRGVPAHRLQVFPWHYDPVSRRLRVYTRMEIDIAFEGAAAARPAADGDPYGDLLRGVFLNPPRHGDWTAPQPAARAAAADLDWYDPSRPWVKLLVAADGVYRVTPDWLDFYGVEPRALDPRTLRLFHLGREQHLQVTGQADGSFDAGDELRFYGRYRRAASPSGERDYESEYGPTDTYWLTWGGAPGLRFQQRSGAPVKGFARREWYWTTAHFEIDRTFDQLGAAPDTLSDRWFWQQERPLKSLDPAGPSGQTFIGDVTGRYDDGDPCQARLKVAITGQSPEVVGPHHTFVKFNNQPVAESVWAGQTSHVLEAAIPCSLVQDRNRVLLQAQADLAKWDYVWFNWFDLTFRRRFHAYPGFFAAVAEAAPGGQLITVEGFRHPQILLFDAANGVAFEDLAVSEVDTLFAATFEDAPAAPPLYVAADSLSLLTPVGAADSPSTWRTGAHGAHYIVLAHSDFTGAARRLAEYRRADGMQVEVVSAEDVYDEFNHGRFERQAVADFVRHAYFNYRPRPAFLLILGDETWDYRGKYTGNRDLKLVPSLYYSAPERGYSPSDYRLALVDGEDLLADLSVGRLAVDSAEEAEAVVDKVIAYDAAPEPGDWRHRVVYAANWHALDVFSAPSDSLAARYTEPLGLQSVRLYAPDEAPLPNLTGKAFLDALNDGALVVNFSGHGASGTMQYLFSTQFPEWDYLNQVRNGPRLPFVLALSCLNGLYTDPRTEGLAELFTEMAGGAIAYVSASAQSRVSQNDLLADGIFRQLFAEGRLQFGPVLDNAKARLLAAHPGWVEAAETMQLLGDPAQRLALPAAADYAAVSLTADPEPVTSASTVRLTGVVRNHGRLGSDSLAVLLLGRGAQGETDTLLFQPRPPFAGSDSIAVSWPVSGRVGTYRLSLLVDTGGRAEADATDNRLDLVLEILAARTAAPLWPLPEGQVGALALTGLVPLEADGRSPRSACQFALSADTAFAAAATLLSPPVAADSGRATYTFVHPTASLPGGRPLFWRVRLVDGASFSPWSATRSFRLADADTGAPPVWRQSGAQLLRAASNPSLALAADDAVVLADGRPAFRPAAATRDDGFTVIDLRGAGVVATDGTYLYAKRWFNDASTIYPGTDFFARIGTGYGGTVRGRDYGVLADSTTAGISATCHSDGYLYSESGHCFQLERLDPSTGRLDTVQVADGLLDWMTGRVVADEERAPGQVLHALITSDGRYVYNVSMSSAVGRRVGWGVRVFDVTAAGWRLVREFVAPPTPTGFTYLWTDGIFADGERLYLVEYGAPHRIRAVDASTGALLDEWTSDQEVTRILTGQYDWVNDRVWLGDLHGSGLFRYSRAGARSAGSLTSLPIGPAAAWGRLVVEGAAIAVTVEAQSAAGWAGLPGAASLAPGAHDLSAIDAQRFRHLRLAAAVDTAAGARLDSWRVEWWPAADLEVAAVDVVEAGETVRAAVRNRGAALAAAASVRLETAGGRSLATQPLPALAAGGVFAARFDSALSRRARAERLRVRILPGGADGDPANDGLEVPLAGFALAPALAFRTWPERNLLQDGDALRSDQALLVEATSTQGRLVLAVDGRRVEADSSWSAAEGLRLLYRPARDGDTGQRRRVLARLVGDDGDLGLATLDLVISDRLAATNVLVHPHPVRGEAAFTFYLSRGADVTVDLYGLSGRRLRRLGPQPFGAGFGQLPWDGRDSGGQRLAAGTYLFVLAAQAGGEAVQHRAPLAVLP